MTMQIEDVYWDERCVTCECGFDGDMELQLVCYGFTEIGEWDCPECKNLNEYSNDSAFDRADEYRDRMKDERAWSK